MQIKDWTKGVRIFYLLVIAGVILALIVLNRQLIEFFARHFQLPLSALLVVAGVTLGLGFGIQLGREQAAKQVPEIQHPAASGDIYNRIGDAITAFPLQYPDHKTTFPKLDPDIRPWLKESGIAKNDAETLIFSRILSEHYKPSPDR